MPGNERRYEPVEERTRGELEEMLASDDPAQIGKALWSAAFHDSDWKWAQSRCLESLTNSDLWVRRNAVTCLGLLAVFDMQSDLHLVLPALHEAARDPDVKPWVEDALADIQQNVKPQ